MLFSCSFFLNLVGISAIFAVLSVLVWNACPVSWLCDYGESPSAKHINRMLKPRNYMPYVFFLFLLYSIIYATSIRKAYIAFPQLIVIFSLLQLSISDIKFRILQDQWILIILVSGLLFPCALAERL